MWFSINYFCFGLVFNCCRSTPHLVQPVWAFLLIWTPCAYKLLLQNNICYNWKPLVKHPAGCIKLKLTVLSDSRRRRLQHVLREVNEDLVELATTQQVEVLNNLQGKANVSAVRFAVCDLGSVVGANLELFQQIRLLHHQSPEMLRGRQTPWTLF